MNDFKDEVLGVDQFADDQAADCQVAGDQADDRQVAGDQADDRQVAGDQVDDRQVVGGQADDRQVTGEQAVDRQVADDQAVGDQAVDDQAVDDRAVGDQVASDQVVGDQVAGDQVVGDQDSSEIDSKPGFSSFTVEGDLIWGGQQDSFNGPPESVQEVPAELVGIETYSLSPVTPADAQGLKKVLLEVIGNYDNVVTQYKYLQGNNSYYTYVNEITPDYPWIASALLFIAMVVSLFQIVRRAFWRQ